MTGIIKHSGTRTSQIAVGRVDQRNCNYGYLSVHAYLYLCLNKYCHSAAYIYRCPTLYIRHVTRPLMCYFTTVSFNKEETEGKKIRITKH